MTPMGRRPSLAAGRDEYLFLKFGISLNRLNAVHASNMNLAWQFHSTDLVIFNCGIDCRLVALCGYKNRVVTT